LKQIAFQLVFIFTFATNLSEKCSILIINELFFCCEKCDKLTRLSLSSLESQVRMKLTDYGFSPWINWESERTGFGKLIRKMAFYPSFLPLFVSSDHYVDHLKVFRHNEYNFTGSTYFTWNRRKSELMLRAGINAVHIIHPFMNWYLKQKKEKFHQNGTLVFWPHSSQFVRVECNDLNRYFELLKSLPSEYHPIKIVISSQDISSTDYVVKNEVNRLFEGPFAIDTIGNILNKDYYKFFYSKILNSKLITSSMGGSQMYYALGAGIPYWIIGEELFSVSHKVKNEFVAWNPSVDYPDNDEMETHKWLVGELKKFEDPPNMELLEFVWSNLGIYSETRRFTIVKEVWTSLIKSSYMLPKLYTKMLMHLIKRLKGKFEVYGK
jgi:hypothetical protein